MTLISYATPRDLRIQKAISRVATEVDATGTPYSLKLINNSASQWVFYVYQQLPNQLSSNVF